MFKNFKEETLYNYENIVFKFIDKYANIFNRVLDFLDLIFTAVVTVVEKLIFSLITLLNYTGKFMRYSTFPLHWIWIKLELKKRKNDITDLAIFKKGAHYITGKPAAGKSTLVYHLMLDYAYFSGKCAYTTEYFELPRTDVFGNQFYYHQVFCPSDFFSDGKQIASFDNTRFNIVVYEEMLTKYQQRRNKERAYNDEVLPMIAALGTQRHQGIDMFYFISQLPRNDIAIMQLLVGYHEPKIRKVFDYKNWLETGTFRLKIKGWWIKSSKIEITTANDFKKVKTKRWWYPNKYNKEFKYFNKLNMTKEFAKLPVYKGEEMKI